MSLYYEAAEILQTPSAAGGSLKSIIFSKKGLKSQPAQIFALTTETCKWSSLLKEIIERAGLLTLERKFTPTLSLLLVHDLLLAKKGIALPAGHGLRTSIERHKARLQAEFTKARIRRGHGTMESLKQYINEISQSSSLSSSYPRWIRINTLKTQLEDQLETTFADFERVGTVEAVRQAGFNRIFIDIHVPNLIAVSPTLELTKNEAYLSGKLIFQDKASCFPAYLLDPLPEDGDIIDTCAAPGNKTTHIASILASHASDVDTLDQTIHAFEKNKVRAETLQKMVGIAGSQDFTVVHPGIDFLKVDPFDQRYKRVSALLLDPSCSGSGMVSRDNTFELHVPVSKTRPKSESLDKKSKAVGKSAKVLAQPGNGTSLGKNSSHRTEESSNGEQESKTIKVGEVDVDGDTDMLPPTSSHSDLQARLAALSAFQLSLLLHAMTFPAAQKIAYSTCSVHIAENEAVVIAALDSEVARKRGWRLLRREDQVRGMREWPLRGAEEAFEGVEGEKRITLTEGCIRARKKDEFGTMGFFLAGFVRDDGVLMGRGNGDEPEGLVRDENGRIVRDVMGAPVVDIGGNEDSHHSSEEEEWNGFGD